MCEHIATQTFKTWLRQAQPGAMVVYAQPRGTIGFEIFAAEQKGIPTGDLKALMATTQWAGEQGYVWFFQKRLEKVKNHNNAHYYEYRALRTNKRYRESIGEISAPLPISERAA
jgi:hypothetical protein